ncbi:MAG: Mo-dependent nitrogenase C-terminal domain-containing protein [Cyanobacteriota bacterium]|nr:Mo-dependent nitrogenase C-terminal domain-containing protein [Cyanobacteriota bacterium]
MIAVHPSPYTQDQLQVWLRGLLTVAWADGDFDSQEQTLITTMTQEELAPSLDLDHFEPITAAELRQALGKDTQAAENFLRMAVMVALADGTYSPEEDYLLQDLGTALNLAPEALSALRGTLCQPQNPDQPKASASDLGIDPLKPAREWLDHLEVHDPRLARFLCRLIPSQCPFERDIVLFNHKLVHIPPMCKINPLYEQLVGLRFRALSYLADECGEDVTALL